MSEIKRVTQARFSVNVEFDDGLLIRIRKKDAERFKLTEGAVFDIEELQSGIRAFQLNDAYESALCSLDVCARTEKEVRLKLASKGFLEPVIDAVCERLISARLVDDRAMAEKITQSLSAGGKGKYALIRKLRSKGIEKEVSEEALESVSDESQAESAYSAAQKLMRKYEALDRREAKNKLSRALATRGFSWDSIEYALERVFSLSGD